MVTYPNHSFGFMLLQITQQPYRLLVFASSDFHDPTKHPKLVVSYKKNQSKLTSQKEEERPKGDENSASRPSPVYFSTSASFSCKASPRKFLAIIFPSGSIR